MMERSAAKVSDINFSAVSWDNSNNLRVESKQKKQNDYYSVSVRCLNE